ncbi:hypothetical protein FRB95_000105 [Tulasnella sp. JGI-2019a]|nr:hypothetical protein FRB95_000105 [Tulasnella sp. JGI-2019a]
MEVSHLLALKVMRVTKPTLAASSQPFFSTSAALSAHASASLLSLQGSHPLSGHPKTLRDFSLSELITLPSTFGAISLGEVFSSAFCINNECDVDVSGVHLRVEIQTATTKIPLAEYGGLEKTLKPDEALEGVISHEIKELNQHVLACTVSYLLPDSLVHNHNAGPPENPDRPNLRVFRKYYKFTVTNPLSVKTKVHMPKSPTALMSLTEREKVFLEVHVQNLSTEPMCLERMKLECVEGWDAEDINVWTPQGEKTAEEKPTADDKSVFSGATAIMHPQDTRQYLYILTPKDNPMTTIPVIHQPGSSIPLGKLDISWRSGRLLTSVLSRWIPLLSVPPPVVPPVPAIPPHLQNVARPQSPGGNRPGSPAFRIRNAPARPQSPVTPVTPVPPNPQHISRPDVEVDLVVLNIPRDSIIAEKPFTIDFRLSLSATLPSIVPPRGSASPTVDAPSRDRIVQLVVQHVSPPRPAAISQSLANAQNAVITAPEVLVQASTRPKSPYGVRRTGSTVSLSTRSDSTIWGDPGSPVTAESVLSPTITPMSPVVDAPGKTDRLKYTLPAPFREVTAAVASSRPGQAVGDISNGADAGKNEHAIMFIGSSVLKLPPFRSPAPSVTGSEVGPPAQSAGEGPQKGLEPQRWETSTEFSAQFYPLRDGFSTIGGMRVILVEDREVPSVTDGDDKGPVEPMEPKILKEWEHIGELWVRALS